MRWLCKLFDKAWVSASACGFGNVLAKCAGYLFFF